jgi:hypothetical protein
MGRWQQREIDVALDLQACRPSFQVVPVLLQGCEPPLGFLRQLTWMDLRADALDQCIVILAKAARDESPGPELKRALILFERLSARIGGSFTFAKKDAPFFLGRGYCGGDQRR